MDDGRHDDSLDGACAVDFSNAGAVDFEVDYDDDDFSEDDENWRGSVEGDSDAAFARHTDASSTASSFVAPEQEYDSEDERQTSVLEDYVYRHTVATPPKNVTDAARDRHAPESPATSVKRGDFRSDVNDSPALTEEVIRESVRKLASRHLCWSQAPAKNMKFVSIKSTPERIYSLETFVESRGVRWSFAPFQGQPVDGPQHGAPPEPWTIPVQPPEGFHAEDVEVEVPHTASVRRCHACDGQALSRCALCKGKRNQRCPKCKGSGKSMRRNPAGQRVKSKCACCCGRGKKKCLSCGGDGKKRCGVCDGAGRLKHWVALHAAYETLKDEFVDEMQLPLEMRRLVASTRGDVVFEETKEQQVWPLSDAAAKRISSASGDLCRKHREACDAARLVRQRHRLVAASVAEVAFKHRKQRGVFWVYGKDNDCFFPEYPEKRLKGCTII